VTRLETVAEQLSSQPFLLGENFTVADAYLFFTLSWGNMSILYFPLAALASMQIEFPSVLPCKKP